MWFKDVLIILYPLNAIMHLFCYDSEQQMILPSWWTVLLNAVLLFWFFFFHTYTLIIWLLELTLNTCLWACGLGDTCFFIIPIKLLLNAVSPFCVYFFCDVIKILVISRIINYKHTLNLARFKVYLSPIFY